MNFSNSSDIVAFKENWCGPENIPDNHNTLVAKYPKPDGSDGQSVNVFCYATPARFYELVVEEGIDSEGKMQPGYRINTGSSQAKLAAMIAESIADGMLGFTPL